MKKTLVISFMLPAIICSAVYAGTLRPCMSSLRVPEPRLIYPTGETLSTGGAENVTFRWSPHEGFPMIGKYYDFRLYNGYDMVESTLILKEKISGRTHKHQVPASVFRPGETYTWALRMVYPFAGKSRKSFSSFLVVQ
ncbi:MAG: hypothetical protein ABH883_07050 [Candidatus Omnitrophota bacterium]